MMANNDTANGLFNVRYIWSYVDHKSINTGTTADGLVDRQIYVGCYLGIVKEHLIAESDKHFVKIEFFDKVSYCYLISLGIPQDNILSPYKA